MKVNPAWARGAQLEVGEQLLKCFARGRAFTGLVLDEPSATYLLDAYED